MTIRLEVDPKYSKPITGVFEKSKKTYFKQEVYIYNGGRFPQPFHLMGFDILDEIPSGMYHLTEGCFEVVSLCQKGQTYANDYPVLISDPGRLKQFLTPVKTDTLKKSA